MDRQLAPSSFAPPPTSAPNIDVDDDMVSASISPSSTTDKLFSDDVEMKDAQAQNNNSTMTPTIHAPPSPAPSGDSQGAATTVHRPSPSPISAPPSFTASDHPETSIPSPASPSSAVQMDPTPPTYPPLITTATASSSSPGPMSAAVTPSASGPMSLKHEHSDDEDDAADAMIDEEQRRPAKRAKTADVSSPPVSTAATIPPPSADLSMMAPIPPPVIEHVPKSHTILSVAQHKFAMSALKSLRKQKDSYAFNVPVDPILLKIPHYFGIVKQPMDFSTIEAKLVASNPAKRIEQSMASQPRYYSILEFNADVQLVFDNCYLFNGPDHIVSQSARRLQATFEKLTKNMPPPQAPAPVFKSPTPTPQPAPQPAAAASTSQPKKQARRSSASVPTIRRVDSANANEFVSARPKREIHPPAPKDSGYEEGAPKRAGGPRVGKNGKRKKDDGTLDQLRFCGKIITDLYKKQYAAFAGFFYDPVDENIAPNYYKVIKKPMDMSTMKRNLDQKQYSDANAFYDDFQLMISNCVRYNPVGTHVYIAGQDLAKTFNDKWRQLPPLHTPEPSDEEEEEEEEGPDTSTLQHLEAQLAGLRQTIEGLKKGNKVKSSPAAKNSAYAASRTTSGAAPAAAATAKAAAPAPKKSAPKKSASKKAGGAGAGRRMLDADATLTFEEKKELSEAIQDLDGPDLEEVIKIIQQGVADIGENTDEIEIEIDALPPAVLRALWAVVIKPKQPVATAVAAKPFKSGRNQAGTGGLKRKSMDENAESEKMRLLEQRVQMFDAVASGKLSVDEAKNGGATAQQSQQNGDADSTHSSDSESDDSDSDSD